MNAFDPTVAARDAERMAELCERAEAADILDRSADHVVRFGLDKDRSVIGTIAAVAYGDPTAPIASQGGPADRAVDHLFWHLGVRAFTDSLLPTADAAEKALRNAAASLRQGASR